MTATVLQSIQHSYNAHIPPSIREQISQQKPLYLACSGGRDSMALLYGLLQLRLPLHVLHVNHQIQTMSDTWQNFVEQFCQVHQIPYQSIRLSWRLPVTTVNEQLARTARYQALFSITGENAVIALAHHADDQAETLLMNLCQGTGITGLAGMKAFSPQTEFGTCVWLWRPLLSVSRDTISQFVSELKLPYVDDPTNIGEHNQRAWLRQHIMPKLAAQFSGMSENISRTAQNAQEANTVLQTHIAQHLTQLSLSSSQSWTVYQSILTITELVKLPKAERFLILHTWVKGTEKFAPNRQCIEQIDYCLHTHYSDYTAIVAWQGTQIRRYRDRLYRLEAAYAMLLTTNFFQSSLIWQPQYALRLASSKISTLELQSMPELTAWQAEMSDEFRVRPVQSGEKFLIAGKSYHQSLKKLCQRLSIPPWERQLAVVLEFNFAGQAVALILPSHTIILHSGLMPQQANKLAEILLKIRLEITLLG